MIGRPDQDKKAAANPSASAQAGKARQRIERRKSRKAAELMAESGMARLPHHTAADGALVIRENGEAAAHLLSEAKSLVYMMSIHSNYAHIW
jgi:hypothetical protein